MRPSRTWASILVPTALLLLVVAGPAPAGPGPGPQSPERPHALDEAVERALSRRDLPAGVAGLLREGLASFRAYERTGSESDYRRAAARFADAAEGAPHLVAAHYGEGLARARGPEIRIPGAEGVLHRPAYALSNSELWARRALRRAVELDPTFEPAAVELGRLAVVTRHPDTVDDAAEVLERCRRASGGSPGLLLVLSDVLRAADRPVDAARMANRALERGAGPSALHARAAALLRIEGREALGADLYVAGIRRMDAGAARRYFDDARTVFRPGDREAWESRSLRERREWLADFWRMRAAGSGVSLSTRLASHARRLAVAHREYRRLQHRGPRPVESLHVDSVNLKIPFDDRGLVYLRYGRPDTIIRTTPGERLRANESWYYRETLPNDHPLLLNFFKYRGHADFLLGSLPPCDTTFFPRNVDDPLEHPSITTEPYVRYMQDRVPYDPRLGSMAARCFNAVQGLVAGGGGDAESLRDLHVDRRQWEAESRVEVARLLRTEDAAPEFDVPLTLVTSLYAFRGREGRTALVAPILIPGEEFTPEPLEDPGDAPLPEGWRGWAYPFDLSLIVIDPAGRVERTDTVQEYRSPARLEAGEFARTFLSMDASPSDSARYRIVVRNAARPGEGQILDGSRPIPDYGGDAPALSDILLAEDTLAGRWRRGEAALNLVPSHRFEEGSPVVLFYEVYHLPPETPYRTTIRIEPVEEGGIVAAIAGIFGGGGDDVTLTFRGTARDPHPVHGLQEIRTVATSLEPKAYRLTVEVVNEATSEGATRTTDLTVVEASEG